MKLISVLVSYRVKIDITDPISSESASKCSDASVADVKSAFDVVYMDADGFTLRVEFHGAANDASHETALVFGHLSHFLDVGGY